MTWILSFLMGNPLGRTLAKYALVVAGVGLIVLIIFRKGKKAGELDRALATVKAMKERVNVDMEIRQMDVSARRTALKRWVR